MNSVQDFFRSFGQILQGRLFPRVEQELGELGDRHRDLLAAVALLRLESCVGVRQGRGRPAHDRAAIARALVAKAIFQLPSTRALLDRLAHDSALRRLCGWESVSEVPDESVFSRAFAEFADSGLAQRVHEELIRRTQSKRLIGHILRDATAIEGREKPVPKPPQAPPPRRSHKKAGTTKRPELMTRIERQAGGGLTLPAMLAELPRDCNVGCKPDSKGKKQYWTGYKLHLDVADGQIPISCVLTSASLNDNQVAIPLATMTAQRVTSCYDLMDAGYDCEAIRQHSRSLGHVPIIEHQKHGAVKIELAPAQRERYKQRTAAERVLARLKEEFGGRTVRVRGWAKVMAHLMFGILALCADQILRWSGVKFPPPAPAV
jgi:hypothetical protein